jgi:hypothetical protein
MKKNKNKLFLIIPMIVLAAFFWVTKTDQEKTIITDSNIQKKQTPSAFSRPDLNSIKAVKKTKKKVIARSIASVPRIKALRKVIGSKLPIDQIHISNTVSSNWKAKYTSNFKRMVNTDDIINFEVKNQKSVVLVKRNHGINVEHVIVSYKTTGGVPFSFEAYINSETGQMVQSWNKTRLEIRRSIKLSPVGKEFSPTI